MKKAGKGDWRFICHLLWQQAILEAVSYSFVAVNGGGGNRTGKATSSNAAGSGKRPYAYIKGHFI